MSPSPVWQSVGRSDVGCVRQHNEDAWLARPEIGLWAVADGMGGHSRGDVASRTIVDSLAALPTPTDARGLLRSVEEAVATAHARLLDLGRSTGDAVGSTVVVLLTFDGAWAVLWAGDSRIYRLRGGELVQLTRDHSLVQEMVDAGRLTAPEARHHPWRNRITRAIGIDREVTLDRQQGELAPGDIFLLCSDGLTGHLDDHEIAATLQRWNLNDAADRLIKATLADGATDNVTVVLVSAEEDIERTHPG